MNWAIIHDPDNGQAGIDYIQGRKAATQQDAENLWRNIKGLFFLPITVRRTTKKEDSVDATGEPMTEGQSGVDRLQGVFRRSNEISSFEQSRHLWVSQLHKQSSEQ